MSDFASLVFIALLSDENRPEMVVDFGYGKSERGVRVYRDADWRRWVDIPLSHGIDPTDDAELEPRASAGRAQGIEDEDGPSQWDSIEELR